MAAMSDYLENQLIDHIFRTNSFSKPSTLAIGLWNTVLDDTSTGATFGEVSGGTYTRQTLGPDDAAWSAGTGSGITGNLSAISWTCGDGGGWGVINTVAILDDTTIGAGNILFYGLVSTPRTINNGDVFTFDIGNLLVQIDN